MDAMDPGLRGQFSRLGVVRGLNRLPPGPPAAFILRLVPGQPDIRRVDGMLALARRGMAMLAAKRAIEELAESGHVRIRIPAVGDQGLLRHDLAAAGIAAWPT